MFEYSLYWLIIIIFVTITLFLENIMYSFEIFFETFIMTSHVVSFCDYSILLQKLSTLHPICTHSKPYTQGGCVLSQSYPTLSNPTGCTPPGPSVRGIFRARTLERVAISFFKGCFWPKDRIHISCIFCIGRQILYWCATWEAPTYTVLQSY